MAVDDRRIAWLLRAELLHCGSALAEARLTVAAQAGFRVVAMDDSTAIGGIGPAIEAESRRLGMQCLLVSEAAHCRIDSRLCDAERWSLVHALSRDGFEGLVLCEACDSRAKAESLLATARVLLRDLDQLDWESYHQNRIESFPAAKFDARAKSVAQANARLPSGHSPGVDELGGFEAQQAQRLSMVPWLHWNKCCLLGQCKHRACHAAPARAGSLSAGCGA